MFRHEHHQRIQRILQQMDATLLCQAGALFGGGTLITLLYGEYRWSKDIDFICPTGSGYHLLRSRVSEAHQSPALFFASQAGITFTREIKADQYGIRFPVSVDGVVIKIEMVAEARIALNPPGSLPWAAVPCLNFADCCAEKLLANADRWADSAIESRDLIDLAVLRQEAPLPAAAIAKAEAAYPVIKPLQQAIDKFLNQASYREKCFAALQITDRDRILKGVQLLQQDCAVQ